MNELQDILANLVQDTQFFWVAVARWSQDTLATVLQQPGDHLATEKMSREKMSHVHVMFKVHDSASRLFCELRECGQLLGDLLETFS